MAAERRDTDRPGPARRRRSAPVGAKVATGQLAGAGNRALSRIIETSSAPKTSDGVPVQRDVVSDVEDRMSYGAFDWAITDSEAIESLNMLGSLTVPALQTAMGRLSQTAKSRLLDNMPASARRTSAFTKVLVAMGPDAVQPYVQELLSYGLFDWAITDSDAEQVFRIYLALQPAQRTTFATRLGVGFLRRLAENLNRSAALGEEEQAAIRQLFDATPDSQVATLQAWIKVRFRIEVGTQTSGGEEAEAWDGPSLRRLYNVLQSLPPGAVETNPDLLRMDRYKATGPAGGYYSGSDGRVALGYADIRARDSVVDASNPTGGGMGVPVPLQGQNLFDGVVRHEVGHAVDRRLGLEDRYCIGNAKGGNWQRHGDGSRLAETMVSASSGHIKSFIEPTRSELVECLQGVIDDRKPEETLTRLEALDAWGRLSATEKDFVRTDPAVRAVRVSFADKTPGDPWYSQAQGGEPLGGRVYIESYEGLWHSYDVSARARKLSKYQFRAPGEWIAEVYNYYYAPPTKGALVAGLDPDTKAWFDVNVDEATGGEGAAAPGPALPDASTGPGYP